MIAGACEFLCLVFGNACVDQMREGHAPRFANSGFTAGHGNVVEVGEAVEAIEGTDEHFPSPDAAIGTVARSVEREANDWTCKGMLCHAGGDMGVMMLNRNEAEHALGGVSLCPAGREIAGMQVVRDNLRFDYEGVREVG